MEMIEHERRLWNKERGELASIFDTVRRLHDETGGTWAGDACRE
jgi:hypothetical protein